ncbi:unnamed protein product [Rotaria sp. Silwood1]|nr:unnamed protein product [Rotaria sp. Silwood1]CAF0735732.1 unnamed protein product [Rotaria sp. Silwood1]CAF3347793.1 unnamed protein product [Rotaria sp. Silwood1]CAF3352249.1 unnamed protein product [Rotaria sp. Silwood1]CAF3353107.1 unnamed protein product [Rotaria sp. Silwood1]
MRSSSISEDIHMDPSTANMASKMTVSSATFAVDRSNPNLVSSNFYSSPPLTSTSTSSNNRYSYTDMISPSSSTSSSNYNDLLHTWHYHRFLTSTLTADHLSDSSSSDYHSHNGSFHQYYPHTLQNSLHQQTHDEILLKKFHRDTLVNLDTGELKNIQHLTKNDLLKSAKQSHKYSSLLARVDYIGSVDKSTGRVELRFYIEDIGKTASCYVLQAIPFFVHQYSCWSSISPEHTHRQCGLKCRQLECGDIIIAITEQQKSSSSSTINDKPDYNQSSSTKCVAGRYMNGQISSSNKRYKASNE